MNASPFKFVLGSLAGVVLVAGLSKFQMSPLEVAAVAFSYVGLL